MLRTEMQWSRTSFQTVFYPSIIKDTVVRTLCCTVACTQARCRRVHMRVDRTVRMRVFRTAHMGLVRKAHMGVVRKGCTETLRTSLVERSSDRRPTVVGKGKATPPRLLDKLRLAVAC